MKKTKIICTMGPSTNDRNRIKKLIENGMDIARFNFSHGDHKEQKMRMDLLKSVREEMKKPIAILLDTKGPEIRTGLLRNGKKVQLHEGNSIILTTEEIVGDEKKVSVTYKGLTEDIRIGNTILIDDGLIELEVKQVADADIFCVIKNGGELGERKGVNVPNIPIRLPVLTEKDRKDILFGIEQDVDFIAASFVRSAEGILEIKELLKKHSSRYIPVIAKIENAEGVKNMDEIIQCADGVMVARGDLGVEIAAEEVPYLQKVLIQKCNEQDKPVITATQMLDSMIRNPRPTRAEVTDVANAVYDGTDAVMLSGETAQGKYPVEALQMMAHIVEKTEEHLDYELLLEKTQANRRKSISGAIGYSAASAALNMEATCILAPTVTGATARVVSKFRPKAPIIGVTADDAALRRMQMFRGVYPLKAKFLGNPESRSDEILDLVKKRGYVKAGDIVVVTAGIPSLTIRTEDDGMSNMMRIAVVE